MTDTTNNQAVHVTADERPHPALQKLARACIALARLRREEGRGEQTQQSADEMPPASAGDGAEVCHD